MNIDEENKDVEQITKEPTVVIKKTKDPKKVVAGKKLADYNKRAKQKQKQIQENQTPVVEEENETINKPVWSISLASIIAIVGLGFTAVDLFLRYKNQQDKNEIPANNFIPQKEDENLYSTPRPQYGME